MDATGEMVGLLQELVRLPSLSGQEAPLTAAVADWARRRGWEVDLWQGTDADLAGEPEGAARHLPLAGRPSLVVRVPGGGGRSVMFNAHADVVPAGEAWTVSPWAGEVRDGRVYGRGACDAKGPLVAGLWAMVELAESRPPGDLMLELVPGEEDSVGVGTLLSVRRGWSADACVVLEPTEGRPRCASRGGVRFEVTASGRAVHGTVKWLGKDAIAGARRVLEALERLERKWDDKADPLFAGYPITRPMTVDMIRGGEWQGMVADRCTVAGYLELLPGDNVGEWERRFARELREAVGEEVGARFSERYGGSRESPGSAICRAAEGSLSPEGWSGFNSGCEAGLRARLSGTPTLVWGPGSLAQAHAADEWVSLDDVRETARRLAAFARSWGSEGKVDA